ncbi:MAG: 30S ribosomal protein S16 [Patescibacteria group bacterium]|nr:30S ribosomal protein S16 [Patescibacteria group bacterium]
MLSIRMQRTGRKGHAMFRVVVQESRYVPTSGKVVAQLGSYDPHAKTIILDKEKAALFLSNGAQPSDRAARLLAAEGVAMPAWVKQPTQRTRSVRTADKRRSTTPPAPVEETVEAPVAEAAPADEPATEVAA